eukprot:NODE_602_length_6213_cov_0.213281.p3 type:complete len:209 gc:universal NODE_602_length_6213_cov_0.213281:431-1057(+)
MLLLSQLPVEVIEKIFIYSNNPNMSIGCKKLHNSTRTTLYLQKLYCKANYNCRCEALASVVYKRFVNSRILRFILSTLCLAHFDLPLKGHHIPFSVIKDKNLCNQLTQLGAVKYHPILFCRAINSNNISLIKRICKNGNSIPNKCIFRYIESLPHISFAVSVKDAIDQMNITKSQKRMLKFLIKHLKDNDSKRIAYDKMKVPGDLAYI